MLKRLELVGFKSFADKTTFDFSRGITGIVGPNGSGKSNIVDAVRWILGEQSAKSLRGGEMADVIFNGSSSRRGFGMAEVTMTFDNARRSLNINQDEVEITRRVYRGSEGEYLINREPSRLKDIKDLFLGSGAGADAYSIIEQGKVEVLLQSSTKERRAIFEEAAGISRFKARKNETLRKLEHVDQNLQRLRDIVALVEKQLRSVKLQAAKAQRHEEYSARLRQLRITLSLQDYRHVTEQFQTESAVLEQLRLSLDEESRRVETLEAQSQERDQEWTELDQRAREEEAGLAQARQRIGSLEAVLAHEDASSADLEAGLAATASRLTELNARLAQLSSTLATAQENTRAVEIAREEDCLRRAALQASWDEFAARMKGLQSQLQKDQADHLERMRQAAHCHNEVASRKAEVETLGRERDRLVQKARHAANTLAALQAQVGGLHESGQMLQARLAAARHVLESERTGRDSLHLQMAETGRKATDLKAAQTGLAGRIDVLETLEASREGLGTGARQVLDWLQSPSIGSEGTDWDPAWCIGMVADVLTVDREHAAIIDLALGDRAQHFIVLDGQRLDRALVAGARSLAGRVSFIVLRDPDPAPGAIDAQAIADLPVELQSLIVARASDKVGCQHRSLAALVPQLLGRTLIVSDLQAARLLAQKLPAFRFVTLAGEILETDGTLTVGAHHASGGMVSRKSELREFRVRMADLERDSRILEEQAANESERLSSIESQVAASEAMVDSLSTEATQLHSRLGHERQREQELEEEVRLGQSEIAALERDIARCIEASRLGQQAADQADREIQDLLARMQATARELRSMEAVRQERQQELTAAQVALAQTEERLQSLRSRLEQLQADAVERRQERDQSQERILDAKRKLRQSQLATLEARGSLAQAYLEAESGLSRVNDLTAAREALRMARHALGEEVQRNRQEWRQHSEQTHARQLTVNDLEHRRQSLAERMRDDYQVDLEQMRAQSTAGPSLSQDLRAEDITGLDLTAVNEEIAELRQKLARLGSVNLESLKELEELQTRATSLQAQLDDLQGAQRSLVEIIEAIDSDSRRLFSDTLEAVRGHFQDLFRKLFGGGTADIVLEDESDLLESGVEINARPPGKELRSISLLSGGEKTLTAVALLLAIFRSKPSPFCILDEVDAALDEANIARFTAVLRDFLDQSQFIIITHSKKTMAAADVLYGITMQESGVSKRVAIRFEDWVNDDEPSDSLPSPDADLTAEAG
jgi:chromosome segregation protein